MRMSCSLYKEFGLCPDFEQDRNKPGGVCKHAVYIDNEKYCAKKTEVKKVESLRNSEKTVEGAVFDVQEDFEI